MPVCLPYASRADVRGGATNGSAKPRRKACSTGRGSGQSGAWGRCVPVAHAQRRPSRRRDSEPQQASGDIKTISPLIACYNGDTPKTGEDDRPMQRPIPKLQWEGTGLTRHCLSYSRSIWQTVSRPSHCGVRFAQVEKRTTPHTRVTKQAESVVGSGGCRLKPFLIRETFK